VRILLVEDNERLSEAIAKGLREKSFAVDTAFNGEAALYQVETNDYDLIILDIMIPAPSGLEVCKRLRKNEVGIPILMLTALDSTQDKIIGLNAGADDYLAKPFEFGELLARVHALLRRRNNPIIPTKIQVGDLVIDTSAQRVWRNKKEIPLTGKEYCLLEFMVRENGRILGRAEIAEHCWDVNFDAFSNIIDVYIKRLRAKIDNGFEVKLIHTRRGAGYILNCV